MQQIEALLTRHDSLTDAKAEALETALPEPGDRLAFRGAITELGKVRDAMEMKT